MVTIWSTPRLSRSQKAERLEQKRMANPTTLASTTDRAKGSQSRGLGQARSKAMAPRTTGGMPRASTWKADRPSQVASHHPWTSAGR